VYTGAIARVYTRSSLGESMAYLRESPSTFWMMLATVALVIIQIIASAVSHGMLMQQVRDLDDRLARVERTLDAHVQIK